MSTTSTPDHRPPAMTVQQLMIALGDFPPDAPVRIVTNCVHDHHVSMFVRHVAVPGGFSWVAVSDEAL